MATEELEKKLGLDPRSKYVLKVNNNRSTMVSVKWEPDRTKVSLHQMFLNAPRNIMDDLACYIRKDHEEISPLVRAYIEDNLKKLDYSNTLNPNKLIVQGNVYNLQELFDEINKEYFDSKLNLYITWFGNLHKRSRNKVNLGLYHDATRLIKINRLMDKPEFPKFVISYVIYHEMLHHVSPSYFDENGKHQVHSKEFKKLEENFAYFKQANDWIRNNESSLFVFQ